MTTTSILKGCVACHGPLDEQGNCYVCDFNGDEPADTTSTAYPETYEVTVWNTINGDIEAKLWDAEWSEVEELLEWYSDGPWLVDTEVNGQ